MDNHSLQLNLARKWRSKTFDQVVGQDLSVRILKNSLYLNHYFPVYLFAGQHGCGKTTMARIFAAAVNCQQLTVFQQNPKEAAIPCLECSSCLAMAGANHPDFIEIDGASHTGVDHVRHIIEVAAFLPIMGRKKIYLIDEAHMLSKAAFNAFLKILEEPPASALFILATTELYKIIETVRSRSFQLFFRAVEEKTLAAHLEQICARESIAYDQQGLVAIVKHTKGSVRDAINLLEQIRFAASHITKKAVLEVLSHTDEEIIITVYETIQNGNPEQLLHCMQEQKLQSYAIEGVYKSLIELITSCIWVSYGQKPRFFTQYTDRLKRLTQMHSVAYFTDCLTALFQYEQQLYRTDAAWELFEMVLLRLCLKRNALAQKAEIMGGCKETPIASQPTVSQVTSKKNNEIVPLNQTKFEIVDNPLWHSFISQVELFDPLLSSIFKQGVFKGFDQQGSITIAFGKEFVFFEDMLEKSSTIWKPLLNSLAGKPVQVKAQFQELSTSIALPIKKTVAEQKEPIPIKKPVAPIKPPYKKMEKKTTEQRGTTYPVVDTSDTNQWKKAALLKTFFPGTIYELPEGT